MRRRCKPSVGSREGPIQASRGAPWAGKRPAGPERAFFAGEAARREAANAETGRVCARAGINCAHVDAATWRGMVANIHAAAEDVGRHVGVFMDVAGPKVRTGAVKTPLAKARPEVGEALRLTAADEPWIDERTCFSAHVSLAEMVTGLSPGDRIRYDDGKLEGVVEGVEGGEAIVRVTHTKAGGTKLKPEKGLNLPVLIARGDLAAELGFDRVAEMQEELVRICEAASVPAIWATQVLEDLMKTVLPLRGEMTDAAMAGRAKCAMLNRGPAVVETIGALDGLLARMNAHMFRKTRQHRALKSR